MVVETPTSTVPHIGALVRQARIRRDLGLRDLARILRVTPTVVADVENDRQLPTAELLQALTRELGLNPAQVTEAMNRPRVSRGS